jgi:hypothetical protein
MMALRGGVDVARTVLYELRNHANQLTRILHTRRNRACVAQTLDAPAIVQRQTIVRGFANQSRLRAGECAMLADAIVARAAPVGARKAIGRRRSAIRRCLAQVRGAASARHSRCSLPISSCSRIAAARCVDGRARRAACFGTTKGHGGLATGPTAD